MTAKAAEIALGVILEGDSQLMLVARFAAAYMLAFGMMLLFIASNPHKFRLFAFAAVVLFGIRLLNRILLFNLVSSTFGMSAARNVMGTAIIFVFFALIFLTMPKKSEITAS
jgi:hypothetical protein